MIFVNNLQTARDREKKKQDEEKRRQFEQERKHHEEQAARNRLEKQKAQTISRLSIRASSLKVVLSTNLGVFSLIPISPDLWLRESTEMLIHEICGYGQKRMLRNLTERGLAFRYRMKIELLNIANEISYVDAYKKSLFACFLFVEKSRTISNSNPCN